jgi:hypothetical protein
VSGDIKPAITAEAWAGIRPDPPIEADFHARKVARHNAKLPDGDPRKITRADVKAIQRVEATLRSGEWDLALTLDALADKLAALLPPE